MQYPSDERPGRRGLPQSRTRITDPATSASTYAIRGARNRTWRRYSPGRGCSLRQEWREKEPEVVQQASVKVFLRVGVPSGAASARMLSFFFIESLYLLIIFSCQCVFIKTKVLTCLQLQFRMWEFSRYLRKINGSGQEVVLESDLQIPRISIFIPKACFTIQPQTKY